MLRLYFIPTKIQRGRLGWKEMTGPNSNFPHFMAKGRFQPRVPSIRSLALSPLSRTGLDAPSWARHKSHKLSFAPPWFELQCPSTWRVHSSTLANSHLWTGNFWKAGHRVFVSGKVQQSLKHLIISLLFQLWGNIAPFHWASPLGMSFSATLSRPEQTRPPVNHSPARPEACSNWFRAQLQLLGFF